MDEMNPGDIVRYLSGFVRWRVTTVRTVERKVSIELVRNPRIVRYQVPAHRLRLFEESRRNES